MCNSSEWSSEQVNGARKRRDERRRRTLCSVTVATVRYHRPIHLCSVPFCGRMCSVRLNALGQNIIDGSACAQMECMQLGDMSGYKTSALITIKMWLLRFGVLFGTMLVRWCYGLSPCLCGAQIRGMIAFHVPLDALRAVPLGRGCVCDCKLVWRISPRTWFARSVENKREREKNEKNKNGQINFEIIYCSHKWDIFSPSIRCSRIDDSTDTEHQMWRHTVLFIGMSASMHSKSRKSKRTRARYPSGESGSRAGPDRRCNVKYSSASTDTRCTYRTTTCVQCAIPNHCTAR